MNNRNIYQPEFLYVNDIKLAYIEAGAPSLTTLLFIHGVGENSSTWLRNIDSLKNEFHCFAIDLPGHGLSGKSGAYTPFVLSELVAGFMQQLALGSVILAGHSLGGQIAIMLGLGYPAMVEKLVLISPAGFESFTEHEKKWLTDQVKINSNPFNDWGMIGMANFLKTNFPAPEVYRATVEGMLHQQVFEHLHLITQPAMVIFGEDDPFIPNRFLHPMATPRSIAEAGANQIPDSKLIMIPHAGHFVHFERDMEVNGIISNFVL